MWQRILISRKTVKFVVVAASLLLIDHVLLPGGLRSPFSSSLYSDESSLRNPPPQRCNGGGSLYAEASPFRKVSKENALKIVNGGYAEIAQGSSFVDMVGMIVMKISNVQHSRGMFGSVGELGVHHGRFTSCIFITASRGEKLVVADVFEQQEKNVDGSGLGNRKAFMKSLEVYGLNENDLHTVHVGSTTELTPFWNKDKQFEQFRFVSIDAGHSTTLTKHDMYISACNLLRGGVIALDDLFHWHWTGVTEGIFQYFNEMREFPLQLIPFLLCDNKMFLTNDADMHTILYNELRRDPNLKPAIFENATHFGGSKEFIMNNFPYLLCSRNSINISEVWSSMVM